MPKHLTPVVHASWLHRDDPSRYRDFEFPARPTQHHVDAYSSPSQHGACGETPSTGTGLPLRSHPLADEPVPVGHLTLIDRVKAAAR